MELVSGNIMLRPNYMDNLPDKKIFGHKHNFDHTSFVVSGSVQVRAVFPDGRVLERVFGAGKHFLVRKEVEHEITALEPNTVFFCIYSHRTPQGDVVQEDTGWDDAYQ